METSYHGKNRAFAATTMANDGNELPLRDVQSEITYSNKKPIIGLELLA